MGRAEELLERGLKELNISCGSAFIKKLLDYRDRLVEANRRSNLIKAGGDEILLNHIMDSLCAVPVIEELLPGTKMNQQNGIKNNMIIGDLGSGGGLPGIPLALCFPQYQFDLIERSVKKSLFLKEIASFFASTYGADNINVVCRDFYQIKSRYILVVFRALAPLGLKFIKKLARTVSPGGLVLAYKGRSEKIKEELALIRENPYFRIESVNPYSIPFLERERHFIVLKKREQ